MNSEINISEYIEFFEKVVQENFTTSSSLPERVRGLKVNTLEYVETTLRSLKTNGKRTLITLAAKQEEFVHAYEGAVEQVMKSGSSLGKKAVNKNGEWYLVNIVNRSYEKGSQLYSNHASFLKQYEDMKSCMKRRYNYRILAEQWRLKSIFSLPLEQVEAVFDDEIKFNEIGEFQEGKEYRKYERCSTGRHDKLVEHQERYTMGTLMTMKGEASGDRFGQPVWVEHKYNWGVIRYMLSKRFLECYYNELKQLHRYKKVKKWWMIHQFLQTKAQEEWIKAYGEISPEKAYENFVLNKTIYEHALWTKRLNRVTKGYAPNSTGLKIYDGVCCTRTGEDITGKKRKRPHITLRKVLTNLNLPSINARKRIKGEERTNTKFHDREFIRKLYLALPEKVTELFKNFKR